PRGCAGHDDVAGFKRDHFGQLVDDLRYVPDHLGEIAILTDLSVALERDAPLARMADLARRLQRAAGSGRIECFADLPWALHVTGRDLQIAAREIDADAIAPYAIRRLSHRDVAATALECDDEFNLVMHVLGE